MHTLTGYLVLYKMYPQNNAYLLIDCILHIISIYWHLITDWVFFYKRTYTYILAYRHLV